VCSWRGRRIGVPCVLEGLSQAVARLIDRKAGHFDPKQFEDRYENAVLELIRAKQAGRTVAPQRFEQPAKVINLMDALKRSIEAEKAAAGEAAKRRPPAKSKPRTAAPARAQSRSRGKA
jgi:DNA end-binding protein Ku